MSLVATFGREGITMQPSFKTVPVLDLLLHRDNPRHVSKSSQDEVIAYLLKSEEVYNLARHMAARGINPLEVVAVFPDDDDNMVVAEGNRRVCAAQLLTDWQKAPDKDRMRFKKLAAKAQDVSQVNVALFPDYETAQPWLQVLHDGEQDGVGRRRWKPEQKARATTSASTDALAVALLDYAAESSLLDAKEREKIQVSTVTRYLANPNVRDAMGIASTASKDEVIINTDEQRFLKVLNHFIEGVSSKRLHSRSKTKEWLEFADEVVAAFPPDKAPVEPHKVGKSRIIKAAGKALRQARVRLVSPDKRRIERSSDLVAALNALGSFKLSSLYKSLTELRLDEHPALAMTGAWAFFEAMTALHGRTGGTEFTAYVAARFNALGIDATRENIRDWKTSLSYIHDHGNAEKHSAKFTAADASNLSTHFDVLDDVIVALVKGCPVKGRNK